MPSARLIAALSPWHSWASPGAVPSSVRMNGRATVMGRAVVLVPVTTAAFWSRASAWGQQLMEGEEALGSSQGFRGWRQGFRSEPKMDYRLRPRMFRADSGRPLCNLHDPLLRFCAPTTLRRIARAANAADVLHSRHSPSLRGERRHRTIPSPRGVIIRHQVVMLRRIVHRRVRLTASVDNPFSAPTGRCQ